MGSEAWDYAGSRRVLSGIIVGLVLVSWMAGVAGAEAGQDLSFSGTTPESAFVTCGTGCQCLTDAEAKAMFGNNYELCSDSPCGESISGSGDSKFCFKAKQPPPVQQPPQVQVPGVSTGLLSVSSQPSGAEVWVDGQYRGSTPVTLSGLSPGYHNLQLTLAGYQSRTQSAPVSAGATTALSIPLVPSGQGISQVSGGEPQVGVEIIHDVEVVQLPDDEAKVVRIAEDQQVAASAPAAGSPNQRNNDRGITNPQSDSNRNPNPQPQQPSQGSGGLFDSFIAGLSGIFSGGKTGSSSDSRQNAQPATGSGSGTTTTGTSTNQPAQRAGNYDIAPASSSKDEKPAGTEKPTGSSSGSGTTGNTYTEEMQQEDIRTALLVGGSNRVFVTHAGSFTLAEKIKARVDMYGKIRTDAERTIKADPSKKIENDKTAAFEAYFSDTINTMIKEMEDKADWQGKVNKVPKEKQIDQSAKRDTFEVFFVEIRNEQLKGTIGKGNQKLGEKTMNNAPKSAIPVNLGQEQLADAINNPMTGLDKEQIKSIGEKPGQRSLGDKTIDNPQGKSLGDNIGNNPGKGDLGSFSNTEDPLKSIGGKDDGGDKDKNIDNTGKTADNSQTNTGNTNNQQSRDGSDSRGSTSSDASNDKIKETKGKEDSGKDDGKTIDNMGKDGSSTKNTQPGPDGETGGPEDKLDKLRHTLNSRLLPNMNWQMYIIMWETKGDSDDDDGLANDVNGIPIKEFGKTEQVIIVGGYTAPLLGGGEEYNPDFGGQGSDVGGAAAGKLEAFKRSMNSHWYSVDPNTGTSMYYQFVPWETPREA